MLTCEDVSKLDSELLDRKLPFGKRIQLWTHLSMCGLCSRFRQFLVLLQKQTRLYAKSIEQDTEYSDVKLSDECRERIKRVLESQEP